EFLQLKEIARSERGWRVRFAGPLQRKYRSGLQVAFVVFVPNREMAQQETGWILQSVRWRGDSIAAVPVRPSAPKIARRERPRNDLDGEDVPTCGIHRLLAFIPD